jgi:hypothetical protein
LTVRQFQGLHTRVTPDTAKNGIDAMSKLLPSRLLGAALVCCLFLYQAQAFPPAPKPGGDPGNPGGNGPAGSYNGPGDTVPQRGGPNGYNNLCPCPSTCSTTFSKTACQTSCDFLLPFDGASCANKTCFDPNAPFPVVNYRTHSFSLRYSDWILLDLALQNGSLQTDNDGNITVCATHTNAQEVYVIESHLINGRVSGPNGPCQPGFPAVEAEVWRQYIYGNPCGSYKIHQGTFCFLTDCIPCGFAAAKIIFQPACMRAAITWLQANNPGALATNPVLFNIGFLGCGICQSEGE